MYKQHFGYVYIYIYVNTMQSSDKVEKEALKGNMFSVNYENLFFLEGIDLQLMTQVNILSEKNLK